jgi:DNA-binding MarR family transcriptional regulator
MEIHAFFTNYNNVEQLWTDFLSRKFTYRNASALGMTALRICYYVTQNPNCALKEIAFSLNISLGSASQMVQAMNVGGLLYCTPNKDDRRRISITPQPVLEEFFNNISA